MRCAACHHPPDSPPRLRVVTVRSAADRVVRYRVCPRCGARLVTVERPRAATA